MDILGIIVGIISEGLIYSIVSFGVYITYKILDFPDMTVDGSFPLGMSITAILSIMGINPILTLIISFILGAIAGILTGLIHVKLKVGDLLSGIIMMIALYSVNLRIAGRPNLPFFDKITLFRNDFLANIFGEGSRVYATVAILIFLTIFVKILLDAFLSTKRGYLLRSVGDNETLITSLAIDKGNIKIMGLAIANGIVAFAGSIYAHDRSFFEISAGTGTLVIAVSNVIIGMQIMNRVKFLKPTTAVILGSLLYRAIISMAISFGLEARDLKLITAVLLLVILILNKLSTNPKVVKK